MEERPFGDLQPGMAGDSPTIQPGSTVRDSDGSEVGTVVSVQPDAITVKRRRLLGGTLQIPRARIKEAEEGIVQLDVPAGQIGRR